MGVLQSHTGGTLRSSKRWRIEGGCCDKNQHNLGMGWMEMILPMEITSWGEMEIATLSMEKSDSCSRVAVHLIYVTPLRHVHKLQKREYCHNMPKKERAPHLESIKTFGGNWDDLNKELQIKW